MSNKDLQRQIDDLKAVLEVVQNERDEIREKYRKARERAGTLGFALDKANDEIERLRSKHEA